MGKRKSAGILLYRDGASEPEVLLVFHGGPYWKGKDLGTWTIPKGEFEEPETAMQAALREFEEETGTTLPANGVALKPVVQKGGKQVFAFAQKGNLDATSIRSNMFTIEWPPKSGKRQSFPEVAKAQWFPVSAAREKINAAQLAFLDELLQIENK